MIPEDAIKVLNLGYVRLVDCMGSDLTVANSARVSYNKQKFDMDEKDERLIRFLAREGHTSPFRHAMMQFEIYAPLMVARQHWKYVVGSSMQDNMVAWNESSRRYVTEEPAFYVPSEWREAPENSKQGSGGPLHSQDRWTEELWSYIDEGLNLYQAAIDNGMAPEQARLFLPAYGMYVRYYWTASLQGVCHFLNQRLAHDSQKEIQEYAGAVLKYARDKFPVSVEALVDA